VSERGAGTRKTRSATVADELRRMIRAGELAPGTRLRQDELAERFGVSSTPVREALTLLTRERLVRHDAHRGAVVFPPTQRDVLENFEIRLALEPLATRLAAGEFNRAGIAHLEELVARVDQAVGAVLSGGDLTAYEQTDRALHRAIFAAADRPRLLEMIESLRDAAAAYAHLHVPQGVDEQLLRRLHEHHAQLVDALRTGDADRAQALAADHVWLTAEGSGAAVR
jgi:DNA-binding GntR family transcriptional regulator